MSEESTVPKSKTCSSVIPRADGESRTCSLPPDHAEPQDDFPQGTPHQDSTDIDELTGKPFRWWG